MKNEMLNFENGIHIEENVFDEDEIASLKKVFFEVLEKCENIRKKNKIYKGMDNTVHHVLLMNQVFEKLIEKEQNKNILNIFFNGKKYILNSFGGNNNLAINYASSIHRDVRFYTSDRLMVNSIWCISDINESTGGTQFLLGSQNIEEAPSEQEFDRNAISIKAKAGSIIYFDSRIWHRAGIPTEKINERVIYTPIYSRPFIKPGFDYSKNLQQASNLSTKTNYLKQLCSYYSDIPGNHDEWYGFNKRRFYLKDQDD